HTFPLIAVARALRVRSTTPVSFLYLGPKGIFGRDAMGVESIPSRIILSGKVRRYFSFANFTDPFKIPVGFLQALWHLYSFMPDVVFAKGGSVSVPVCLAAVALRIPIVLHDSDAVAGKANVFLSTFASRIAVAYGSAAAAFPSRKTAITGNPVRAEMLQGNANRANSYFGLSAERPLVLVLGGSLGARALNTAVARMLPDIIRETQVLHQTGEKNYREAVSLAGEYGIKAGRDGYVAAPFLSGTELADALSRADLVISRAGAGAVSELAACGKAVILVPLASAANDEQRMNAYEVAAIGAAVVLEEANLGEHMLSAKVDSLLRDPVLRTTMSDKIRAFHNPAAADMIADGIISLTSRS
ncbi:MAG TPA: UDP-N-acetylglucosamine--N-acetylmuramyl-(pentapeptide) pyrophosphoryl-undecaprenol N-acetylglucosamine transferase, partial [Candidatus Fimivivens sp.]|nr:UDP-N-acetylglucosamine--N-acetylmuramyl-(pentapeptide) pyrophosphoryl-undecaprenol N-acetylglucosamine transferase [Candidatus Fimivivens sp.]